MYQNVVDVMGFLAADAENRTTKDGVPFTVLSLATKRSWKDAQGDWQSHSDWHRVTCFGAVAEFAASLKKGAHIHVTGKTKKNSTTVKVLAWEVRAIRIAKLDRAVEADPSTDIPTDDPIPS
ncbi:MAG: single-stranded DNA-binding protein [Acidobacteriota bacterium]|nr:single-stranded DNA-binding protein [Acidobacteriota bacterium]